jgi:hypothetical protein
MATREYCAWPRVRPPWRYQCVASTGGIVAREGRQGQLPIAGLHRIGGYLFIGLFCVMAYFMVARLRNGGGDTSPTVTAHLGLAMILSPLLFIKVLIARYYKNQHGLLIQGRICPVRKDRCGSGRSNIARGCCRGRCRDSVRLPSRPMWNVQDAVARWSCPDDCRTRA